eukprot:COSAG01_NODE_43736_length_426_cov_7.165714_1_plen_74_part_00
MGLFITQKITSATVGESQSRAMLGSVILGAQLMFEELRGDGEDGGTAEGGSFTLDTEPVSHSFIDARALGRRA